MPGALQWVVSSARSNADGEGCRQWMKSAALSWLLNTQLCPVIWALILALLAVLIYKVCHPCSLRRQCSLSTP